MRKVIGSNPAEETLRVKFPEINRSMPDLESAKDMASSEPRFSVGRHRTEIAGPVFVFDRLGTRNNNNNDASQGCEDHVENGTSVDAKQNPGLDNRRLRGACRIGMEVTGSNPANASDFRCKKPSKNIKEGLAMPSDLMRKLIRLVKSSKPKKHKTSKHSGEEMQGGEVSHSECKERKKRRGRKIECDSESQGFDQIQIQYRQKQKIGVEASFSGKNKSGKASHAISRSNEISELKDFKHERSVHGEVKAEFTEGQKLEKQGVAIASGMAISRVGDEAKISKFRKGKRQCEESVGSLEPEVDADREPRKFQRKKHRRVPGNGNVDGNGIDGKIVRAAMGHVSSASAFTESVSKELLMTSYIATMSRPEKSLPRTRGRPKKESANYLENGALQKVNTEEPGRRKAASKNKQSGTPKRHKAEEIGRRKETPNEPKINGFRRRLKGNGASTEVVDAWPLGEDPILMRVPKFVDGSEGQKELTLTEKKPNVDAAMVEGIVTDKTSPAIGEDVSSVLTEVEGNRDSKILNTEPEKPREAWVSCDDCKKWRCIPVELANHIEATNCRWTCRENSNKEFADCSIPQEKSNAEINAELDISEVSNCDENENTDGQVDSKAFNGQHTEGNRQNVWTLITQSMFKSRARKTQTVDEIMVCQCKPPEDGSPGCGDECLNRMLSIECVPGTCPCGEQCSNQRFQRRSYAKVGWIRCGKKGFGLQILEDVPSGTFIIEYVGEVLEMQEHEARQREYASRGQKHFYFMTLNSNEVIDACVKGNLGRYINHSCNPNCQTEKWMVNGEVCVGFFAIRDLVKGEEVTFDYNYVRFFGAAAKKCECGSVDCRGFIGGDPITPTVVVENESDGEDPEPIMLTEESEDVSVVVDCNKTSQIAKLQNSSEAKVQGSDKVQSNCTVKKSPPALNNNDKKDSAAKKLKRLKTDSVSQKSSFLNSRGLTISTSGRFEGVEEKLNEMLDGSGGIAKRRDAAKHYLKLLVVTAASGDALNGEASGSTRDLSMVLDAILKTESRSVLMDIANKNGLQLLHNMIKQHRKKYNKIPIIRKLLKVFHYFATKQAITLEQINSGPSRKGVESFKESILILTRHSDIEVQKFSRRFRDNWIVLHGGNASEGKQLECGPSLVKVNNQTWRKQKMQSNAEASSMNRFKIPGNHVEGITSESGQVTTEINDTHVNDEKVGRRICGTSNDWNSPSEQIYQRKGKRKSDFEETRQCPISEKLSSDSLPKDSLAGESSNIQGPQSCGPFPLSNISKESQWSQGSRRNFRNKNRRWRSSCLPRHCSSHRSDFWQETMPCETETKAPVDVCVSDRKIEQQFVVQPNTVTTANVNRPTIMQQAPPPLGSVPSFPNVNGFPVGSMQEMLLPQMPVAYGVPLALFQQLYGVPICRSVDNSTAGGQHLRETGSNLSSTPCRIPCEHFSMPQIINTIMRPFHNSGGRATTLGYPRQLSVHSGHPFVSPFTSPVRAPSSLHSGVRPPQYYHASQGLASHIHQPNISCEYEKSGWTVSEEGNCLEPEPPVPGLSPPRFSEARPAAQYQSSLVSAEERSKSSALLGKKRELLYKKDNHKGSMSQKNTGDLPPNLSHRDTTNQAILSYDREERAVEAFALDGCASQISCHLDCDTTRHASLCGNTDCDSQRSSPLYMDRVRLHADEIYSPETGASSNSNNAKFSGPCHLEGIRQRNLSFSKCDTKFKEYGTVNDAQSLTHNGEHREANEHHKEELACTLKSSMDCSFCKDEGVHGGLIAADGNPEIQPEYCDKMCPLAAEVLGQFEDGTFDQGADNISRQKVFNPGSEAHASQLPGD